MQIFLSFSAEACLTNGELKASITCAGGESKTLVVNNLSYDATEDSLQEVFEKASAIRIPQNNQGRSKGYVGIELVGGQLSMPPCHAVIALPCLAFSLQRCADFHFSIHRYAFVDFATAEDAKEALNSCNNTEIEGRTIRLEFSTPAGQNRNFNARGGFGRKSTGFLFAGKWGQLLTMIPC